MRFTYLLLLGDVHILRHVVYDCILECDLVGTVLAVFESQRTDEEERERWKVWEKL